MSGELVTRELEFLNHTIMTVVVDGEPYFAPRHTCDWLGLSWGSQSKKFRDNPEKFRCVSRSTTGKDGKTYEMILMPAEFFNVWITELTISNIRGKNAQAKKEMIQMYKDQLREWLHARNFLTREEIATVTDLAVSRGATGIVTEIENLIALPTSSPEMEQWKNNRTMQLTDERLGFATAEQIGRREELSPDAFYRRWVIEQSCDDRMVLLFPELGIPQAVWDYANKLGIKREEIPPVKLAITQQAELAKAHIQFKQPVGKLVLHYNYPAELIHKSVWEMNCYLLGVFHENIINLGPDPIDWQKRRDRNKKYYQSKEWKLKRGAFFIVFNCCVDCGIEHGWEIVSKNFNAHHRNYLTIGVEHPYDLLPLCRMHHDEREKLLEWEAA